MRAFVPRRGGFAHSGHTQGDVVPAGGLDSDGLAGQDRGDRDPHPHQYPHFTRSY